MIAGELLLTAAEIREVDCRAVARGTQRSDLMTRAAAAVAERAVAMTADGDSVLLLCGPGDNGGDGFVAARLLRGARRRVEVTAVRPAGELSGEAEKAAAGWDGLVRPPREADFGSAKLIVDALFGTGLARDLEGPVADVIDRINAAGRPVLAVDMPSGIDADTGQVRGVAIRADRTVTFASRKPGHLLFPGREYAGIVEVADIGISADLLTAVGSRLVANGPRAWAGALPRLKASGHKYDRGHAIVVSGGAAHTGAARLAARGALRAGAGLVTVITSLRALAVNAAHLTAIMLRVADDPDEFSDILTDDRFNALALGPALGVGEATRGWVSAALEADRATVLDADALTSFAEALDTLVALIGVGRETSVVLTPHDGEFERLFSGSGIPAGGSKVDRARRAAELTGAVIVLKGPDSVIAAPDGRAAVNANGVAYLATAGSGDVLGGMIAGLMAQGMSGFEAAAAAVWMHADAAARFGPGLIAEDLPEMLPAVWRGLLGWPP